MHDLAYFREHLELFEQMACNRNATLDFEGFRALDRERRDCITAVERLKAERNKANDEIVRRKKAGQDAAPLLADMKRVSGEIASRDAHAAALDARLREFMLTVPNMPHSSVPVGSDASANVEVRRWGAPPKFDFTPKPHWELGENLDILDLSAAVKMSGARFALYRGAGARLAAVGATQLRQTARDGRQRHETFAQCFDVAQLARKQANLRKDEFMVRA